MRSLADALFETVPPGLFFLTGSHEPDGVDNLAGFRVIEVKHVSEEESSEREREHLWTVVGRGVYALGLAAIGLQLLHRTGVFVDKQFAGFLQTHILLTKHIGLGDYEMNGIYALHYSLILG